MTQSKTNTNPEETSYDNTVTSNPVAEKADHTELSETAMQNGYSGSGDFCGSLVHKMFVIYSPDDTNVFGTKGEMFQGARPL